LSNPTDDQPALPGQVRRFTFKAERVAKYGDGEGSKLERKMAATLAAENWEEATSLAPGAVSAEHGTPEADTEAAAMALDLLSVTHKVVRK